MSMSAICGYSRFQTPSPKVLRQSGFTLVEIMVALTLGLLVMAGVIQVFISTQQSARIQQAASRMQEDGRMATALISRYFRYAGYTTYPWDKGGTVWALPLNARGFPASAAFVAGGPALAAGQVVGGTDNLLNGLDADVIRLRYQGAADGSVTDCLGRVVPVNQMADIMLSLSANNPMPAQGQALMCTVNGPGGVVTQPLVAGLEGMAIWYGLSQGAAGIDANGRLTGATAYVPAAQVPATNWNRVISLRVSLLVRTETDGLTLQSQTVTFNGTTVNSNAPTDNRMRYVMGTTTNVRNQAP